MTWNVSLSFCPLSVLMTENLSREKHEEFGDVKKVVTDEFVRQR